MDKRFYYIDALRVIAILMMFVFHVAMVFVADWSWHIKNSELSNVLLELNFWMSSFRMPLLFFVSGYISYILMQKMSWLDFTKLRFQRLLIPTFIWTFILVAPQMYFERKLQGNHQSYFDFYQSFLVFQWWPEGNFHWLHLWFIPYLFCYNLLSLPIYHFLQQNNKVVLLLGKTFQNFYGLILLVLVGVLPYSLLFPHFPASYDLVNDWARHLFFFSFILMGLLCFRFPKILTLLQEKRHDFLMLAFSAIVLINLIRWNGYEPSLWGEWNDPIANHTYLLLLNFNTWMWVFTSLGYGKQYLNKKRKALNYANTAVYPFYILHQTVIVIVAYYIVQTNDSVGLKFCFLLVVCFIIILLIYHLFIRPFNWVRFLFGMKKVNK